MESFASSPGGLLGVVWASSQNDGWVLRAAVVTDSQVEAVLLFIKLT